METEQLSIERDYEYLVSFLPQGWREKAKELGALRRCRKVPNADTLRNSGISAVALDKIGRLNAERILKL